MGNINNRRVTRLDSSADERYIADFFRIAKEWCLLALIFVLIVFAWVILKGLGIILDD